MFHHEVDETISENHHVWGGMKLSSIRAHFKWFSNNDPLSLELFEK